MRQIKNIEIKINLPMNFPEEWDTNEIEFYLNNSSYCCDNLIKLCSFCKSGFSGILPNLYMSCD